MRSSISFFPPIPTNIIPTAKTALNRSTCSVTGLLVRFELTVVRLGSVLCDARVNRVS